MNKKLKEKIKTLYLKGLITTQKDKYDQCLAQLLLENLLPAADGSKYRVPTARHHAERERP